MCTHPIRGESNEEKDAFHDKLYIKIIGYVTSNLGTENIYK
jgi:hypothetical protein